MSKSKVLLILRRVFSVLFAVILALFLPVCALLGVFTFRFADVNALAKSIVNEAYLSSAEKTAEDGLKEIALIYGVEEAVLTDALPLCREELREAAVSSVASFFDSLFSGSAYCRAEVSAEAMHTALSAYVAELRASEKVEIRDDAVEEIVSDCNKVLSSAAAPVGDGLLQTLLEKVGAVVPSGLSKTLAGAFWILAVCLVGLSVAIWFLQEKKYRLFGLFAALFCGATLYFVPAFFLFSDFSFSALPLAEGVLFSLVSSVFEGLMFSLRVSSAVLFSFSVIGLVLSVVLLVKAPKTDEAAAECSEETL